MIKKANMLLILLAVFLLCSCTPLPKGTVGPEVTEALTTCEATQNESSSDSQDITDENTVPENISSETTEEATEEKSTDLHINVPQTSIPETYEPQSSEPQTSIPESSSQPEKPYCTVVIKCTTVLRNFNSLKDEKKCFVPSSGVILSSGKVYFTEGDSAFDVLQKACQENTCDMNCIYCQDRGIQLEYNYTPAFSNYYVEGIHQIYEKDCGSLSGWMYSVNGSFPSVGMSQFPVSEGDIITIEFTCDMGEDIGNLY